jgi:hypothetical protein
MKNTLLVLTGIFALAACGPASSNKDAGTAADSGPASACGHPGDMGNSLGVGKYCASSNDCPSTAALCSTIEASILDNPSIPATNFCLIPECDPCSPAAPQCGENAFCACYAVGECGCAPLSCMNIQPLDAGVVCVDAGPSDAGNADAGAGDAGSGDAGTTDAGTTDGGH